MSKLIECPYCGSMAERQWVEAKEESFLESYTCHECTCEFHMSFPRVKNADITITKEGLEAVKKYFSWDDRENLDTFTPCEYCIACNSYRVCSDGATSSACNHCDYNIVLQCLQQGE